MSIQDPLYLFLIPAILLFTVANWRAAANLETAPRAMLYPNDYNPNTSTSVGPSLFLFAFARHHPQSIPGPVAGPSPS